MTIAEVREKCKSGAARILPGAMLVPLLVTAAGAGFGAGFLSGKSAGQGSEVLCQVPLSVAAGEGHLVASKNGTKYYLPTCTGAQHITSENQIWFATAAAAQAAGYTPATHCPGL